MTTQECLELIEKRKAKGFFLMKWDSKKGYVKKKEGMVKRIKHRRNPYNNIEAHFEVVYPTIHCCKGRKKHIVEWYVKLENS